MRLIGLLSFYDEPVEDLVACLASLKAAGVDEIVAVDGAYALYPNGQPASAPDQHAAITLACRHLGMGCTLHIPGSVWAGNEVEKRTLHFKLALAVAEDGDWFWICDADEVVIQVPDDLKDRLEQTEHDCADIEARDTVAVRANIPNMPPYFSVRHLFRAQPIHVATNHITYVAGDGRVLWGYEDGTREVETGLDLTDDVLIEHRPDRRPPERMQGKYAYYATRDREMVERGACQECGEQAVRLVPVRWRMTGLGPVADWMEACAECAVKVDTINRLTLEQIGIDPNSVSVENRMGRAPAAQRRQLEMEAR